MKHGLLALALVMALGASAIAADKPNILVIWGDDIGQSNISNWTHGMMGYQTPNIERLAARGMTFSQAYSASPLCSPTRAGAPFCGAAPSSMMRETVEGDYGALT